jgi:protein YIPF5/7
MWQDQQANSYNPAAPQSTYYSNAQPAEPLQFYDQGNYYNARADLQGNVGVQGSMATPQSAQGFIQTPGPWWTAFGPGGFEGEPPLLEGVYALLHGEICNNLNAELGINFSHIRVKSMTVLNPLGHINANIMDDADLAGPLIFCFCFATFLLFVSAFNTGVFCSLPRVHRCSCAVYSQASPNSDIYTALLYLVLCPFIRFLT